MDKLHKNLPQKVARQNPTVRILGIKCIQKMLTSSCEKFPVQTIVEPSCVQYRKYNLQNLQDLY
ncbi:MAG: hypothetical protein AAF518_01155 [Spirochaetota bacterium]